MILPIFTDVNQRFIKKNVAESCTAQWLYVDFFTRDNMVLNLKHRCSDGVWSVLFQLPCDRKLWVKILR